MRKNPIIIEAESCYKDLLPKGRRQAVLMSAAYIMDGKSYRVIGSVKKSLFGKIKNYEFIDFIVVDEDRRVIKDEALSKRIFYCFATLSMMFVCENHFRASTLENPHYFLTAINKYDQIIERIKPFMHWFKGSKEFYYEKFDAFSTFLVEAHETNISADQLARELTPVLMRAKEHERMLVLDIEAYQDKVNKFYKVTDQRTKLALQNRDVFPIIKVIIDTCRTKKNKVDLSSYSEEMQLMRDIVIGARKSIFNTMVQTELFEKRALSEEEIIENLEKQIELGTMLHELTEKAFNNQWLYRKEVRK